MIRDPSDGAVYDPPKPEPKRMAGEIPAVDTGLPAGSQKEKNLQRLEASRKWLKDYHQRRGK